MTGPAGRSSILSQARIEVTHPQFHVGEVVEIIVRQTEARNADEQLSAVRGVLPKEDSKDMLRAVEDAFEQVDPDAWR